MERRVTSVTITKDALGERVSATYSVLDESGKIVFDNRKLEKIVMEKSPLGDDIFSYAQAFVDKDAKESEPTPEKEPIIINDDVK